MLDVIRSPKVTGQFLEGERYVAAHCKVMGHSTVRCAKTAKQIGMQLGLTDSRGSKKPCIRWDPDRFAAARVTSRRCGLLPNYFGHLSL